MKPPDVVIIGARRSGTTSMYNYLAQHPKIHLAQGGPKREVHFCDYEHNWEKGTNWYYSLFDGEVAIEKSPTYLQVPYVAERLKSAAPEATLIVMLRHPIIRAYSDWAKRVMEGREGRGWDRAVKDEIENGCDTWEGDYDHSRAHLFGYLARSRYKKLLKPWHEIWGESIMLLQYEYFAMFPNSTVYQVFKHIGVDPTLIDTRKHWQASHPPRNLSTISKDTFRQAKQYLGGIPSVTEFNFALKPIKWEEM